MPPINDNNKNNKNKRSNTNSRLNLLNAVNGVNRIDNRRNKGGRQWRKRERQLEELYDSDVDFLCNAVENGNDNDNDNDSSYSSAFNSLSITHSIPSRKRYKNESKIANGNYDDSKDVNTDETLFVHTPGKIRRMPHNINTTLKQERKKCVKPGYCIMYGKVYDRDFVNFMTDNNLICFTIFNTHNIVCVFGDNNVDKHRISNTPRSYNSGMLYIHFFFVFFCLSLK